MRAILKRNLGFSKQKGCPFFDLVIEKGSIVEVIKLYKKEQKYFSCWCIKILYNNEKYWCVYDFMTFHPEPCPIIVISNE